MKRLVSHLPLTVLWLLTAAVLVLWARGHVVGDRYRWTQFEDLGHSARATAATFDIGGGGVGFAHEKWLVSEPNRLERIRTRARERSGMFAASGYTRSEDPPYPPRMGNSDAWYASLGVHFASTHRESPGSQRHSYFVTIPLWLLLLVFGAYPATHYARHVIREERAERIARGVCPHCDSGVTGLARCPSCGKVVARDPEYAAAT